MARCKVFLRTRISRKRDKHLWVEWRLLKVRCTNEMKYISFHVLFVNCLSLWQREKIYFSVDVCHNSPSPYIHNLFFFCLWMREAWETESERMRMKNIYTPFEHWNIEALKHSDEWEGTNEQKNIEKFSFLLFSFTTLCFLLDIVCTIGLSEIFRFFSNEDLVPKKYLEIKKRLIFMKKKPRKIFSTKEGINFLLEVQISLNVFFLTLNMIYWNNKWGDTLIYCSKFTLSTWTKYMFTEKKRERKEANIFFKIIVALQQKNEVKNNLKNLFFIYFLFLVLSKYKEHFLLYNPKKMCFTNKRLPSVGNESWHNTIIVQLSSIFSHTYIEICIYYDDHDHLMFWFSIL